MFAIGTIAIERIKGLKLYDVQLQGAITLYEGKIAEMKTGEGKTITSVLPALLRSMTGQVHICTVNKYLAQRDKETMEPIYNFFGRSVALNLQEDTRGLKKEHYKADIVYSTGSTLGSTIFMIIWYKSMKISVAQIKIDTLLLLTK